MGRSSAKLYIIEIDSVICQTRPAPMPEKRHNPFKLKDFHGVDPQLVATLAAHGIKTADQMLSASCSKGGRLALARMTDLPEQAILELVQLSDLARLPGVKGIRARL